MTAIKKWIELKRMAAHRLAILYEDNRYFSCRGCSGGQADFCSDCLQKANIQQRKK